MDDLHIISAVLFGLGAAGALLRRGRFGALMCQQLMLLGALLALVAPLQRSVDGQILSAFVVVIAVAHAAVGGELVIWLDRAALRERDE